METGYTPRVDPKSGAKVVDYRVISSDGHVGEPDDLWTTRIDKEFRDRAVHVESREDGDWYVCEGTPLFGISAAAQPGYRFDKEKRKVLNSGGQGLRYQDARPGAYDPDARVADQDLDGVEKEIIYPTIALLTWQGIVDSRLLSAHLRAYNDFIAEFCMTHPDRLYGIGALNVDDVEEAVGELRRCQKLGLVGALIPCGPPDSEPYHSPWYEPLWAAAADLGMPLAMHVATTRTTPEVGPQTFLEKMKGKEPSYNYALNTIEATRCLGQLICGGALERHPGLQVGLVEFGLAWAIPVLQHLDEYYRQVSKIMRFKDAMVPSDFFHRQVSVGYQHDEIGISMRHFIGVDNIQWGSDYPHMESTWPRSRDVLEENLVECTHTEKAKIAGANATRVFHLDGE